MAAYLLTLAPGLVGGDTPELVTAARLLGIPHQPGYPIYTLLGRLFSLVPIAGVAWQVNLLSAVAGAGAGAILCAWLRGAGVRGAIAALLSMAAGLSLSTWTQSVTAEVYTLGLFLALAGLFLFDRWREGGRTRHLWLAAYVGGLAVGHQPLTVMFLPGAALLLVHAARRGRMRWRHLAAAVLWFGLPFTSFLFLPVRSAAHPFVDYARIRSAGDFFYHALGVASRSEFLSEGAAGVQHTLRVILKAGSTEIGLPTLLLVVLAFAGGIRMASRDRGRFLLLWLPLCLITLFSIVYGIHDIENYLILPFWLLVASAGMLVAERPPVGQPSAGPASADPPPVDSAAVAAGRTTGRRRMLGKVAIALAAWFALSAAWTNRRPCDRSDYHFVDDFVANVFRCVPPNGALFLYTETLAGPFAYHTGVLGERPDIRLIDMTGKVLPEAYGFRELTGDWREGRWDRMEALHLERPADLAARSFCAILYEGRDPRGRPFVYRRRGLVFELADAGAAPASASALWNQFTIRMPAPAILNRERTGFSLAPLILRLYENAARAAAGEYVRAEDFRRAIPLYRQLLDFAPGKIASREALAWAYARSGNAEAAEAELRRVIAFEPDATQALNALAVILLDRGEREQAEDLLRRALAADPRLALTRLNLGRVLASDPSRMPEAARHLETFLEMAPDDPDAAAVRQLLDRIRGAGGPAGR